MTDLDKLRIKPLDEKSDFGLWKIRVNAVLRDKGLLETLQDGASETSSAAADSDPAKTQERLAKASAIIVSTLGDKALCVVRHVIEDPAQMMTKLDERYNSKTLAAKISKMSELVSVHYTDRSKDISTHIDRLDSLVSQIKGMRIPFDDTMAIGILIASIKVTRLAPVVAAIKTIPDKDITWDAVAARLIEDWKDLPKIQEETSFTARRTCGFCGRSGHTDKFCKYKKQFLAKYSNDSDNDNDDHRGHRSERDA